MAGGLYRFPSQNAAILAAVVYATALGIDRWEARRLAGLPFAPGGYRVNAKARLIAVAAIAAFGAALAALVLSPNVHLTKTRTVEAIPNANLPPPWKLQVNVENGLGNIATTHAGHASRLAHARIAEISGACSRSCSRNATRARISRCSRSTRSELRSGRRKSIPCAAAIASMPTIVAVLSSMSKRRRAANVAIDT